MEQFEPDLKVTYQGKVQFIKFNRPEKKNAFGEKVYLGVRKALALGAENDNVTMTVLTGTGNVYSSGNDLSEIKFTAEESMDELLKRKLMLIRDFIRGIIDYPKILVAVVNGPAIGIAATTLGLCDVVYATDNATFQTPFTALGLSAEGCSSYTFPRILGTALAGQLLYFNYTMKAAEAKKRGFVADVVKQKSLQALFDKLSNWATLPAKSLLYTKRMMRDPKRDMLHMCNNMEVERLSERFQSDECMEAFMSFMTRKKKSKL